MGRHGAHLSAALCLRFALPSPGLPSQRRSTDARLTALSQELLSHLRRPTSTSGNHFPPSGAFHAPRCSLELEEGGGGSAAGVARLLAAMDAGELLGLEHELARRRSASGGGEEARRSSSMSVD